MIFRNVFIFYRLNFFSVSFVNKIEYYCIPRGFSCALKRKKRSCKPAESNDVKLGDNGSNCHRTVHCTTRWLTWTRLTCKKATRFDPEFRSVRVRLACPTTSLSSLYRIITSSVDNYCILYL